MTDLVGLYTIGVGVASALGILYLFTHSTHHVGYRNGLYLALAGIIAFSALGNAAEQFYDPVEHWVHGVGALLVLVGLFRIVDERVREADWPIGLLADPASIRTRDDWMTPMDDAILELFHSADLVLTPTVIALNLDRSREEVNRRLSTLEREGYVERVTRGKYRMTPDGAAYLYGGTPT
ncbi:helix-turn-helix domain-containing protein [Natronomonas sp. EA1]|uniref:helix-turn-helix domain-containing protein n=1 Tax=Natronomonas sp. EA1 TaxID=3421655 RepID=UPI003EBD897E